MYDVRALAAISLTRVVAFGESFSGTPNILLESHSRDLAFFRELCYGTLRNYYFIDAIASSMLEKPLPKKDTDIYMLLLIGIYQILFLRTPNHAALNATVNAAVNLKKPRAKRLVNGVLRNFLRETDKLLRNPEEGRGDRIHGRWHQAISCWQNQGSITAKTNHPIWLYESIAKHWPSQQGDILNYNNEPPGMSLRVCESHISVSDYLLLLAERDIEAEESTLNGCCILLNRAVDVSRLPHFQDGWVSVQDAGAQLAANLLRAEPGMSVLDACAAPGGKTTHLLQGQPSLLLTAVDSSSERLAQVADNLARCNLSAELCHADAAEPDTWWNGQQYDRILLDAPCSGSGIISHHPDIKLLRRRKDIKQFANQQLRLLESLWPTLRADGELLYCTCSIMPEENNQLIERFLQQTPSAKLVHLDLPISYHNHLIKLDAGHQLLPNKGKNGGFFYARLSKLS